jgi:hypothetical protein
MLYSYEIAVEFNRDVESREFHDGLCQTHSELIQTMLGLFQTFDRDGRPYEVNIIFKKLDAAGKEYRKLQETTYSK